MEVTLIAFLFFLVAVPLAYPLQYTNDVWQPIFLKFDEPGVTITEYALAHESGMVYDVDIKKKTTVNPYITLLEVAPRSSYAVGYYIFEAQAKDQSQNFMEDDVFFDFIVDLTPPELVSMVPLDGKTLNKSIVDFKLVFNEGVNLRKVAMRDLLTGTESDITNRFSSSDNMTYLARIDIKDGRKSLSVEVADYAGNVLTRQSSFSVNAYPTVITLVRPRFGWANSTVFDVLLTTDDIAECGYNFEVRTHYFPFDSTNDTEHILEDVSLPEGEPFSLHIFCRDVFGDNRSMTYTLQVDTSPPVILELKAMPSEILSYPLNSVLSARADEPVICRYDPSVSVYSLMNHTFDRFDEDSLLAFSTTPKRNLTNLEDNTTYNIIVACKNTAGLVSVPQTVTIRTETRRPNRITMNYPGHNAYISEMSGKLNISTNKNAKCHYGPSFTTLRTSGTFGIVGMDHVSISESFVEGRNQYVFMCTFTGAEIVVVNSTMVFYVDTTPPSDPLVNDSVIGVENPQESPYKDRIYGSWVSYDNESGIAGYNVTVVRSGNYGEESAVGKPAWFTATSGYIDDLNLTNSTNYRIKVIAKNRAGIWSSEGFSDGVLVNIKDIGLTCANNKKDGDETDVDCGGSCPGCADGGSCLVNSDCQSLLCDLNVCVFNPYRSCSNLVKDGEETDVDCGGALCTACANGRMCLQNRDCMTGFCDASTYLCEDYIDLCNNGIKDQDETDMDCGGGLCMQKCGLNQTCVVNSDCQSGNCADGYCGEPVENKDRDDDGILNSEDNCPDDYNPDQSDLDGDGIGDECDSDKDGDLMDDAWESQNGLDPEVNDAGEDPDNDGLTNLQEYSDVKRQWSRSSDPQNPDTDGDKYPDGEEMDEGTDPTDPEDHPKVSLVWLWILLLLALGVGGYILYDRYLKDMISPKKGLPMQPSVKGQPSYPGQPSRPGTAAQPSGFQVFRRKPDVSEAEKKKMDDLKRRQEMLRQRLDEKRSAKSRTRSAVFDRFAEDQVAGKPSEGPVSEGEELSVKDIEKLEKLRTSAESKMKDLKGISKDEAKRKKLEVAEDIRKPEGKMEFFSLSDLKEGVGGLLKIRKKEVSAQEIEKEEITKKLVSRGIFDELSEISGEVVEKKPSQIKAEDIFAQIEKIRKGDKKLGKLPSESIFSRLSSIAKKDEKVSADSIRGSLGDLADLHEKYGEHIASKGIVSQDALEDLDRLSKKLAAKEDALAKLDEMTEGKGSDDDLALLEDIVGKKKGRKK
ncbi:hypothetical protein JW968_05405 [Candidatus Woesearchaeota archaeon]|nr:hypothetical protein [Candidatus Woesearchaeota archaeon]